MLINCHDKNINKGIVWAFHHSTGLSEVPNNRHITCLTSNCPMELRNMITYIVGNENDFFTTTVSSAAAEERDVAFSILYFRDYRGGLRLDEHDCRCIAQFIVKASAATEKLCTPRAIGIAVHLLAGAHKRYGNGMTGQNIAAILNAHEMKQPVKTAVSTSFDILFPMHDDKVLSDTIRDATLSIVIKSAPQELIFRECWRRLKRLCQHTSGYTEDMNVMDDMDNMDNMDDMDDMDDMENMNSFSTTTRHTYHNFMQQQKYLCLMLASSVRLVECFSKAIEVVDVNKSGEVWEKGVVGLALSNVPVLCGMVLGSMVSTPDTMEVQVQCLESMMSIVPTARQTANNTTTTTTTTTTKRVLHILLKQLLTFQKYTSPSTHKQIKSKSLERFYECASSIIMQQENNGSEIIVCALNICSCLDIVGHVKTNSNLVDYCGNQLLPMVEAQNTQSQQAQQRVQTAAIAYLVNTSMLATRSSVLQRPLHQKPPCPLLLLLNMVSTTKCKNRNNLTKSSSSSVLDMSVLHLISIGLSIGWWKPSLHNDPSLVPSLYFHSIEQLVFPNIAERTHMTTCAIQIIFHLMALTRSFLINGDTKQRLVANEITTEPWKYLVSKMGVERLMSESMDIALSVPPTMVWFVCCTTINMLDAESHHELISIDLKKISRHFQHCLECVHYDRMCPLMLLLMILQQANEQETKDQQPAVAQSDCLLEPTIVHQLKEVVKVLSGLNGSGKENDQEDSDEENQLEETDHEEGNAPFNFELLNGILVNTDNIPSSSSLPMLQSSDITSGDGLNVLSLCMSALQSNSVKRQIQFCCVVGRWLLQNNEEEDGHHKLSLLPTRTKKSEKNNNSADVIVHSSRSSVAALPRPGFHVCTKNSIKHTSKKRKTTFL